MSAGFNAFSNCSKDEPRADLLPLDPLIREKTMKRIIIFFAIAGAVIPIILFIGNLIELYLNVERVPTSRIISDYLWPSSIFLIGGSNISTINALIVLLVAVLVNIFLYVLIGLVVASAWALISEVRMH